MSQEAKLFVAILLLMCAAIAVAIGSRHPNWFLCHGHYLHAYGNWGEVSYHSNPNGKGWHVGVQMRTCERCGIQQARRMPY